MVDEKNQLIEVLKELSKKLEALSESKGERYAEKIAEKALDFAMEARSKVEAMEKSTHKAYFVNPTTDLSELQPQLTQDPRVELDPRTEKLSSSLDSLLDDFHGRIDHFTDFTEGDSES